MRLVLALAVFAFTGACGGDEPTAATVTPASVDGGTSAGAITTTQLSGSECADVVDVEVEGDGSYTFAVTVESPDTGWDKYADEWQIIGEGGSILGVRALTHPHVDEQPFTRSLAGVSVPDGSVVEVAARDSVEGYCGKSVSLTVGG